MQKCPIHQFSLTIYEAELLHYINIFHSNGSLANNNQLDYSRLESATITPLISFFKFYQLIHSNSQLINSNQFWISSHLSSTYNKTILGKVLFYISYIHKILKIRFIYDSFISPFE